MKTFKDYIENPVSLEENMKSIIGAGAAAMLSLSPQSSHAEPLQKPSITKSDTAEQNKTPKALIQVGKIYVNKGFRVGSHPNFDRNSGYHPEGGQSIGKHSKTSYHYKNQAIDISARGKTVEEMKKVFKSLHDNRKGLGITQIIYAPVGFYDDRWGSIRPHTKDHYDHIHVAFKPLH